MLRNAERTKRIEIPIENLNRKSSAPRRLWNAELKLSPPNAPPKLEPRCCKRIAATRRTERIIWIYGSAGSTESIIFMPSDSSRKYGCRQAVRVGAGWPKATPPLQILQTSSPLSIIRTRPGLNEATSSKAATVLNLRRLLSRFDLSRENMLAESCERLF